MKFRLLLVLFFLICATVFAAEPHIEEALKAAEQGNAIAQFTLGNNYENGLGVTQDYGEAAEWYKKAADQGNADAQCALGILYERGNGVPKDLEESMKWLQKAAEKNHPNAQFKIGVKYDRGLGVPVDPVAARMWYILAGENGHETAQELQFRPAPHITPAQIEEAKELARNWKVRGKE